MQLLWEWEMDECQSEEMDEFLGIIRTGQQVGSIGGGGGAGIPSMRCLILAGK